MIGAASCRARRGELIAEAQRILETRTIRDTIGAALREVVRADARRLLLAAAAEPARLIVLHCDADNDTIGEVTRQPMEWVVPRGSLA